MSNKYKYYIHYSDVFIDHLLFTVPKVLNKLPAITTGIDQLYIPMAPPLAHVGYRRGGVNVVYWFRF